MDKESVGMDTESEQGNKRSPPTRWSDDIKAICTKWTAAVDRSGLLMMMMSYVVSKRN